jgi:hypothetical protein
MKSNGLGKVMHASRAKGIFTLDYVIIPWYVVCMHIDSLAQAISLCLFHEASEILFVLI